MFSGEGENVFELPKRRGRATLSLAPLIDITFILLIFFLLASQFDRLSPIEIPLDTESSEENQDDGQGSAQEAAALTLTLHADGSYRINDRRFDTPEAASDILSQLRKSLPTAREKILVLKTEPDVSLQQLVTLMELLNQSPEFKLRIRLPEEPASGVNR